LIFGTQLGLVRVRGRVRVRVRIRVFDIFGKAAGWLKVAN